MSNHLIGPELLSLAETEVPPEDLVFHKFYLNKTNSMKKQKKKKKKKGKEEEEDAEELLDVNVGEIDGGDESDNEEIENMLDAADDVLEDKEGEYNYDDLDRVAFNDDDDLVGDASDAEMDIPFNIADREDMDDSDTTDLADDMDIGDADDGRDGDEGPSHKKRRKVGGMSGASPFASLDDYEHLLKGDSESPESKKESKKGKSKSRKNKRTKSSD